MRSESTGELTLNGNTDSSSTSTTTARNADLERDLLRHRIMANAGSDITVSPATLGLDDVDSECTCFTSCQGIRHLWRTNKALFVDVFSRVFFPGMFLIFNIGFWVSFVWLVRVEADIHMHMD